MKRFDFPQYSDEWWATRRGVPTASEFGSIICPQEVYECRYGDEVLSTHRLRSAAVKAAEKADKKIRGHTVVKSIPASEASFGYICQLIADKYDPEYGLSEDYVSEAMRAGTLMEPTARDWYQFERKVEVQQVGFCLTDDGRFGSSPDSLVGEEGTLELKCPKASTHVEWLINGGLPPKHRPQCHGHMIVTGRDWCDFMSYSPGLPSLLVRVERDDYTDRLYDLLDSFWIEYQTMLSKLDLPEPTHMHPPVEVPAALC